MKTCSVCKAEKSLEEFSIRNRTLASGEVKQYRRSQCLECMRLQRKEWGAENPDKVRGYNSGPSKNALTAKRRARLKTSALLVGDEWNEFVCRELYEMAHIRSQETETVWHVDHIVPVQGRFVSGLHVWYNLQLLPAKLNQSKNNSFVV